MANTEFNDMLVDNADFLKPFAINLTKDAEAANDLYQETLYKALANHEKYNAGTNIKAWLFTIMRNIFINDYRRKAKRKTVFDNTSEDFLLNLKQASVPNGAESVLREKEIRTAIDELPEIFKVPFLLYFDGYKYQEIAEYL
ncbi:MAG: RNA polymerase subunit sigma, partial [Sphingobacteriales bacterium SCN 48-20]